MRNHHFVTKCKEIVHTRRLTYFLFFSHFLYFMVLTKEYTVGQNVVITSVCEGCTCFGKFIKKGRED